MIQVAIVVSASCITMFMLLVWKVKAFTSWVITLISGNIIAFALEYYLSGGLTGWELIVHTILSFLILCGCFLGQMAYFFYFSYWSDE